MNAKTAPTHSKTNTHTHTGHYIQEQGATAAEL